MNKVYKNSNETTHIFVEFSDELTVQWQLCSHEAANIWLKCLLFNLSGKRLIKSRFLGFLNSKRDEAFLAQRLNDCIERIVENSSHIINERFEQGDPQEVLNKIHHHFSILIGEEESPSDFWNESNSKVKSSVCGLNDYVHEIEAWRKAGDGVGAYCCVEFFEAQAMEIPKEWDRLFSLESSFGDMTLHYDQIGKTWIEVLADEDDSIIDDAIRPLSRVTGSFNLNFFSTDAKAVKNELRERAKHLGLELENPRLRLGQLKVASLVNCSLSEQQLISEIGKNQEMKRIRIYRGDREIASKELAGNLERYFDEVQWK